MATYRASIQVSNTDTAPMILELEADSDAMALDRAIKCTVDVSHVIGLKRLDWTDVLQGSKASTLAQSHSFRAVLVDMKGVATRDIRLAATSPVAAYESAFDSCEDDETVAMLMLSTSSGWKTIKFADM